MNSIRLVAASVIAGCLFLCSNPALANDDFSSLEERMSGREWQDTGLYKLTPEELEALNRWIRQRSLATRTESAAVPEAAPQPAEDRRGLRIRPDSDPIESRLLGTFSGWTGNDEFELENGMVWRQVESDSFTMPTQENPRVTIRPGVLGSWYLQVEGYNRRTRVERVR